MAITQKYFSRHTAPLAEPADLISIQKDSYAAFLKEGLGEIFKEFSPIKDYSEEKFELSFTELKLEDPKHDEFYARANKLSYETPLKVRVKLKNLTIKDEKEQEIFMADLPLMTERGTFIINGNERVVVPQLARSFGIFFTVNELKGRNYFGAKIIPARGAWIEVESDPDESVSVRIDRKRKFPVTTLLRILLDGEDASDEAIMARFKKNSPALTYIKNTLARDHAKELDQAYVEMYRKIRDSELVTLTNAKNFIRDVLGPVKYDLSAVGRYRFNTRFDKDESDTEMARRTLSFDDIATIVGHIATLNADPNAVPDDIDHMGFRRVRAVGEMLQQKIRVGLTQLKRNIQDKMSTVETTTTLPIQFVSPRPLQARIKEFFNTNQLSQFMSQENVLSELEHLRRLSALGPGGLTRERASLEVRDVHPSHYGRVCPIQTPEGPNIGLILSLASQARLNRFGVIETPYAKVKKGKITDEIVYLNALDEEKYKIAHSAVRYDDKGNLLDERVEVRLSDKPSVVPRENVDFIDVTANQAFSIATSMIPFLEHDDANRALMGSNMQKQATPCLVAEAPVVATGVEGPAGIAGGRVVVSKEAGTVTAVDARHVVVTNEKGKETTYPLINFLRTNGFTALHHRPTVSLGQKVTKGGVLADISTSDQGQIALGQNVLVAFMSWEGSNYEDAIIISERLVKKSVFSSIHVEEFSVNVRDTKLGPEVTTHDIPNVGEAKLKNLDEDGVIRVGAEVGPGDILVGKITPKGETELTPEERLLRSIFGEKARDVKDSSLRMDHGKTGRVIGVKVFSRDRGDKLESGIIKSIHVEIAQVRNVSVGDKLAGRHGNKGVISRILPVEDMPYMADGTPIDVILTPLGVPSRMNLGQILEMHLGLAAHTLGYQAITPPFQGVTEKEIREELVKAGFPESGKVKLYDGQSGDAFNQDIAIGYMYILKLHHMVEDKIHMRSIGPYSLITQQPLGGKAQGGGQRFGEMEVWALEGYGAAHALREMLTIKSDDIAGRAAAFDSIVKGEPIRDPNLPASFNVLLNELRGLCLDIDLKK
jgi:DNA-directed RNA polymerase subunit beta